MPPLRTSAGAGLGLEREGGASVRALATPISGHADRRIDLGMGWVGDWSRSHMARPEFVHGPAIDVTIFTHRAGEESSSGLRGGPFISGELYMPQEDARGTPEGEGGAAAVGIVVETAGGVHMKDAYSVIGGELGIGVSARAGLQQVDGASYAVFLLAIEVRTPGLAGFAIPVPSHRTQNGLFQ